MPNLLVLGTFTRLSSGIERRIRQPCLISTKTGQFALIFDIKVIFRHIRLLFYPNLISGTLSISTQHSAHPWTRPPLSLIALQIPFAFIPSFFKNSLLFGILHVKHAVFLYLEHRMYKKRTAFVLQGEINRNITTFLSCCGPGKCVTFIHVMPAYTIC